jgi:hypothetical protein
MRRVGIEGAKSFNTESTEVTEKKAFVRIHCPEPVGAASAAKLLPQAFGWKSESFQHGAHRAHEEERVVVRSARIDLEGFVQTQNGSRHAPG